MKNLLTRYDVKVSPTSRDPTGEPSVIGEMVYDTVIQKPLFLAGVKFPAD